MTKEKKAMYEQVPEELKRLNQWVCAYKGDKAPQKAFERGADGVIVCGCHPGDCHYTSGNYYARRRMTMLFSMLDYMGVDRGRTRVEWVSAAEGPKFAQTMNEFVKTVTELGENVKLGDIRCKQSLTK